MEFFRCPSCNEMIAVSATQCRFCGCPQTAASTEKAIRHQREVEAAVRSALNIKVVRLAAPICAAAEFYLLIWATQISDLEIIVIHGLPLIACVTSWWWLYKYRGFTTKEPDFPDAVKAVKLAAVIWSLTVGVQLPLLLFLFSKMYED